MSLNVLVFAACATEAMELYGLEQAQLTTISSVASVVSVFGGILFGRMLDEGSVRKSMTLFLALGTALFFVRACVSGYAAILVLTFVASLCANICLVAGPKVTATWFPREKSGAATAFVFSAAGIGFAIAFTIGAIFGLKKTLFIIAFIYLALLIFWVTVGKEGPYKETNWDEDEANPSKTGEKISKANVYKSPNLWKITFAYSMVVTSSTLINTYMINSFVSKGLGSVQASAMGTLLNVGLVVGGYVTTSVLAVVKRFNPLLLICMLGSMVFVLAGWFLPIGTITWICVGMGGLIFGGALGLCVGRVPLIPQTGDFGVDSIGTASGFNETVKGLVSFLLPIVVANVFGTNYNAIFIVFAICCVLAALVGAIMMPELGENGKK
ncbi:MAG: MFS transporter [Clostridiales bacterium]|nr:MFS transporter [Clostridiales bacterium]